MTVLLRDSALESEPRRLPLREEGLEDTLADGTLADAFELKSTFSLTERMGNTADGARELQVCRVVEDN